MSVPPGFESPLNDTVRPHVYTEEQRNTGDPVKKAVSEFAEFLSRVANAPPKPKPTIVYEDEIEG